MANILYKYSATVGIELEGVTVWLYSVLPEVKEDHEKHFAGSCGFAAQSEYKDSGNPELAEIWDDVFSYVSPAGQGESWGYRQEVKGLVLLPDDYLDWAEDDEYQLFADAIRDRMVTDCSYDFIAIDGFVSCGVEYDNKAGQWMVELEAAGEDYIMRTLGLADDMFAETVYSANWLVCNPVVVEAVNSIKPYVKEESIVETVEVTTVESVETDVREIANRLSSLRRQNDELGMTAAGLFCQVKNGKLFKAEFGTFRAFCEHTGWHFTTVYDLMTVYEKPVLRDNYTQLGQLKAIKLSKSGFDGEQLEDLVAFAKDHKAADVMAEIKSRKEAGQVSASADEKPETLQDVLKEQSKLLAEKSELETRLQEVNARLAELTAKVKDLSA